MKKILFLFALVAISAMNPLHASAIGFLNPSFEDPTEGNFWECKGCLDIGNYIVQNDGAFDGKSFAVVLNDVSISQKVTSPDKGDITRLTFWYRNTGNTKVLIKRKKKVLQKVKLEESKKEWKKMKVDNIPQGKKVRVVIAAGDTGYTFFDNFSFHKINRLQVSLTVKQGTTPIEGATVSVVSRKKQNPTTIYDPTNVEEASTLTDADGLATFKIDPSSKKRYIIHVTKDNVTTDVDLDYPKANSTLSLSAVMTGLTLPEPEETP